jgi:hypothetical protein
MQIAMRLTRWVFGPVNLAIPRGRLRPSMEDLSLSCLTLCRCIGVLKPKSAEEAMYRDLSALPQLGHARRRFKLQHGARTGDGPRT